LENAVKLVESEKNYWRAFQILKEKLGQATYRETVKRVFKDLPYVITPQNYDLMWQLPIKGVLTLNLDRLVSKSFATQFPNVQPLEFSSEQLRRLTPALAGTKRFIANLHGTYEDAPSWILTNSELKLLLRDEAYLNFLRAAFSSSTVLFMGVTVDDVAVGGHLEKLKQLGIETSTHYWLTDRRDLETDRWAEAVGIRIIRYDSTNNDHSEVLEFLRDLKQYVPVEPTEALPPVFMGIENSADVSGAIVDLSKASPEELREILNNKAQEILEGGDENSYERYENFCSENDEYIYRAWYTSIKPGKNSLFEFKLQEKVAKGAFGKVYKAVDASGTQVAVKVLLEEIRGNREYLRSFRRGVRSMKILADNKAKGMVAYSKASEIPAFVVMEWIEGPNLVEAKRTGCIDNWDVVLRIAKELVDIIRCAHMLPERVLHRDIRPSNVMLRGMYSTGDDWDLVVLDFDLSWHKGAIEGSVFHSPSAVGYLAPEQIHQIDGVSTRNAAVDSFGIGMTLYFICSGCDPLPAQHKHRDWNTTVYECMKKFDSSNWRSMPARFARLVISATQDVQSKRWDLSEIFGELNQLQDAHLNHTSVRQVELIAEEIASRSDVLNRYNWDENCHGSRTLTPSRVNSFDPPCGHDV